MRLTSSISQVNVEDHRRHGHHCLLRIPDARMQPEQPLQLSSWTEQCASELRQGRDQVQGAIP